MLGNQPSVIEVLQDIADRLDTIEKLLRKSVEQKHEKAETIRRIVAALAIITNGHTEQD